MFVYLFAQNDVDRT